MRTHSRRLLRKSVSILLCVVMVMGTVSFSMAADTDWSWKSPSSSVSITNDDGTRNVTVTCTNAGFNIGEILGADQPAGGMYGRYDGPIKLWTTDINENPDRYVTNLAYLWCKYNEDPAATTSVFPAEQTELSPHQYTLNPVGGTATGQYGRTLAGSGPNTVNKTAVAEYGGIPTVLYSRADIICGSTVSNYEEYLALMHSDEWKKSEFYIEGDENYNPIFVEIGTGTITQRVNSMKDVAAAMNEVIGNSNGKIVARYGDPEVIANDIEKAIYGTYFYIEKLINEGKLTKKNATWIASKNADDGTYTCNYYWMQICHEFFGDIFNGPAEKFTASNDDVKKYTVQELAKMDFILCGRGQKANLLKDFADAGYTKDNIPLLMEDMNHTGFDAGWGMGGASTTWALAYPYSWVYAYSKELASLNEYANPTAMFRYIQEKFCHITPDASESVAAASLTNMWNLSSDIDTVPDKTKYAYDSEQIESFITEGIQYAIDNSLTVNGAYEAWWDPFYQCSTYEDYIENYTNVEKKGCFVSAGIPAAGSSVDGLYVRTGGDSVDTYTYEAASGTADGTTTYYRNYVTKEMFDAYKAGEAEHVWEPDLTAGIGKVEPPADKTALNTAIGNANTAAAGAKVSADGSDVEKTEQWVPQSALDALKKAVAEAQAIADREDAAQADVDAAKDTLDKAIADFETAKKAGTKEEAKPDPVPTMKFTDVVPTDWFYESVADVTAKGYFNGTSDTTFTPNGNMTRAMTVTVLYRMAGSPAVSGQSAFADVPADQYYTNAVKWAADNSVTNGTSATTFSPSDPVTRQQFVTFMYNYFRSQGKDVSKTTSLSAFKDADAVAEYARVPMQWAVSQGVIQGMTDDTIVPEGTASRAQIATILSRVDKL